MSRPLAFPANSFRDLDFLIPDCFREGDPAVPPFLVSFDNTKEAEKSVTYLRTRLPTSLSEKVCWFHSTMTQQYREDKVEAMREGSVWGLCCTDAFGMVSLACMFPHPLNSLLGYGYSEHPDRCAMESDV